MSTAQTTLLGVLGWPVAHSRSPAIHSAALEALGIDAAYLAFAVPPSALGDALRGLRALGARGANVTLPHKEQVLAHLDAVEPDARAIGAVNTIVRDGERLIGANTDGAGLARSLEEAGVELSGARVLMVGAGGAARASVAGLMAAGAKAITLAARRPRQAERVVADLAPLDAGCALAALDLADVAALRAAADCDLFVQATSATLDPTAGAALAARLPLSALPACATVVDLVYGSTAVQRAAAGRGLRTVDGLGMLVWQAALAFERWFGIRPPIDVMRRAASAP